MLHGPGVQQRIQPLNVLQPARHRMETRLLGPGWMSHDAAQRYPLVLSTDSDDTPAIIALTAIHPIWRRGGGVATRTGGDAAIDHIVHEHRSQDRGHGLILRQVNMLSCASAAPVEQGAHNDRSNE